MTEPNGTAPSDGAVASNGTADSTGAHGARPPVHRRPARRDPAGAVTWQVRSAAAWTWRLLLIGFGVYVLVRIFQRVELVAFSFILAIFFTAVLHPLEVRLRRLPGTRSVSAGVAVVLGLAVLGGIGYFVAWQINDHADELGAQLSQAVTNVSNWLRTGPLHLKSSDINSATKNLTSTISSNQGRLLSGAVSTVRTVIEVLGALLLILLSTFFLLRDGAAIWKWTVRLFPRSAQQSVDRAGHAGWHTVGGYVRGQVIIALFHGVSVTIVLFILGVPLAPALGVLIFLGAFVPLLGLTIAGALCTAVALLENGLTAAIVVAIAIVVLVQLETHVLQPVVMSRTVEVHPLAIAISVITGTILAGIVGALLAVPLVAFVNSTVHALRGTPDLPQRHSRFPVRHRRKPGEQAVDGTADAIDADETSDAPEPATESSTTPD